MRTEFENVLEGAALANTIRQATRDCRSVRELQETIERVIGPGSDASAVGCDGARLTGYVLMNGVRLVTFK